MDSKLIKQTLSSFIIEQPNFESDAFNKRYIQLSRIQSHHFFPIKSINSSDLINTVNVHYKNRYFITLADYSKNRELLPSQIKSIIWQITKLMVQCQQLKINHFRLSTKTIVVAKSDNQIENSQSTSKNPFIWVRDFSFGKQFSEVSQGKKLQIFQFMHPNLSIHNGRINLNKNFYDSELDIWSLGIVLYYLIYKVSPFRKEGREVFSKTILRQFLKNQCQIPFYNKKHASTNDFIQRCVKLKFKEWKEIQKFLICEQQIYNQIDFMPISFQQFCKNHIKIMYLFSSIYQMISQQIQKSTHPFWQITLQNKNKPFVLLTSEYVLLLIINTHKRFLRLYDSHFVVLQNNNRFQIINKLHNITESIENQIKYINKSWLIPRLYGNKQGPITLQMIKNMQINFANVILKTGINRRNVRQFGQKDKNNQQRLFMRLSQFRRVGGWRSLEILFDFCDQMNAIFNKTKNHMKLLYQDIYSSKILVDIATYDFKFSFR